MRKSDKIVAFLFAATLVLFALYFCVDMIRSENNLSFNTEAATDFNTGWTWVDAQGNQKDTQ